MSILGKLGSVLDPGEIVKDAFNAVLPKELAALGHVAGTAVDIAANQHAAAAKHALGALRDLPEAAKSLGKAVGLENGSVQNRPRGWSFEPPPPRRYQQVNITCNGNGQVSVNINQSAAHWWARPPGAGANNVSVTINNAPPGQPPTPANPVLVSPSAGSCLPAAATANHAAGITSKADINNLSDADFMNAVRSGAIDPKVASDPAAMLQIQDRMNRITQMNQLMSQMMAAMHQMATSAIQNIRA